jgi:hypothetical protein
MRSHGFTEVEERIDSPVFIEHCRTSSPFLEAFRRNA